MSWAADVLSGIKRVIQLDGDVQRLSQSLSRMEEKVAGHESRLVRIETIIEFSRAAAKNRLPKE